MYTCTLYIYIHVEVIVVLELVAVVQVKFKLAETKYFLNHLMEMGPACVPAQPHAGLPGFHLSYTGHAFAHCPKSCLSFIQTTIPPIRFLFSALCNF